MGPHEEQLTVRGLLWRLNWEREKRISGCDFFFFSSKNTAGAEGSLCRRGH